MDDYDHPTEAAQRQKQRQRLPTKEGKENYRAKVSLESLQYEIVIGLSDRSLMWLTMREQVWETFSKTQWNAS